jgi:hypothetical protein
MRGTPTMTNGQHTVAFTCLNNLPLLINLFNETGGGHEMLPALGEAPGCESKNSQTIGKAL